MLSEEVLNTENGVLRHFKKDSEKSQVYIIQAVCTSATQAALRNL